MAGAAKKPTSKKRQLKKTETVRERAAKPQATPKTRRLKTASTHAARPLKAAVRLGRKEVYLPMPDNRVGNFLNKRRSFVPSYFRASWQELRQVNWPNRKQTTQLTLAVFMFALFFGLIIAIVDYGLDKLFEKLILK